MQRNLIPDIELLASEMSLYQAEKHPDQMAYYARLNQLGERFWITFAKKEIYTEVTKILDEKIKDKKNISEFLNQCRASINERLIQLKDNLMYEFRSEINSRDQIFSQNGMIPLTDQKRKELSSNYQKYIENEIENCLLDFSQQAVQNLAPEATHYSEKLFITLIEHLLIKFTVKLEGQKKVFAELEKKKEETTMKLKGETDDKIRQLQQSLTKLLQGGLTESCKTGDIETAILLMKHNANPLLIDAKTNCHPLSYAIENKHETFVKELLAFITEQNQLARQNKNHTLKPFYGAGHAVPIKQDMPIYQQIRDEFYCPDVNEFNPKIVTVFSLNNDDLFLLLQKKGRFFIQSLHKDQIEKDIKNNLNSLYLDASRSFEHPSGNTYNQLGLDVANNPILHQQIDEDFSQYAPLLSQFLKAYAHQGKFGNSGWYAVSPIVEQIGGLGFEAPKPVIRFKKMPDGSALMQEMGIINQVVGTHDNMPNPEDVIYKGEPGREPALFIITEYLIKSENDERVSVSFNTCKLLYNKSRTPKQLQERLNALSDRFKQENWQDAFNTHKFDAWPDIDINDDRISQLFAKLKLKELNLNGCKKLKSNIFDKFTESHCNETLENLSLTESTLITFSDNNQPSKFPNLLSLDLSNCTELRHIAIAAPKLTKLNLQGCVSLDLKNSRFECPNLSELNLSDLNISDQDVLEFTKKYPKLKNIYLQNCSNVNKAFSTITQHENGIDKFISNNNDVKDWPSEMKLKFIEFVMAIYRSARKLPDELTPLHIIVRSNIRDQIGQVVAAGVPIDIKNSDNQTALDEAIAGENNDAARTLIFLGATVCHNLPKALALGLKKLRVDLKELQNDNEKQMALLRKFTDYQYETLEITNSNLLDNDLLLLILKQSPNLKSLNVMCCQQISEHIIPILEKNISGLRKLNLSGTAIKYFEASFPELIMLSTTNCSELKYINVIYSPKLQILMTDHCPRLLSISANSRLPELRDLSLFNCSHIQALKLEARGLTHIDLNKCNSLKNQAEFLEKYPFLLGINLKKVNGDQLREVDECLNAAMEQAGIVPTQLSDEQKSLLYATVQNEIDPYLSFSFFSNKSKSSTSKKERLTSLIEKVLKLDPSTKISEKKGLR